MSAGFLSPLIFVGMGGFPASVGNVIDLTEQPPVQDIGPQRKPRYYMRDHVSLVRVAIGNQPEYYDEYRFSGRTFKKRDVLESPNHNL